MINNNHLSIFQNAFPQFKADVKLLKQLQTNAQFVTIPPDTIICQDGQTSVDLPLIISGLVRVYKISESGKEITLYHIGDNESCVLSASSILGHKEFPAVAKTVTESQAIVLPKVFVRDWLVQSTEWQKFIFGLVTQRLSDVITVVEEVAFQRMDRRVAKYLCHKQSFNGLTLATTHQEIAAEVGTAREVVTRVLRDLESRDIIKLSRGQIEITYLEQLIKVSKH